MPSLPRPLRAALLTPLFAAAALAAPHTASADLTCTKFASPTGSDSAAGTADAPFRTAQTLADSLAPGEVGCLHGGTYAEDVRVSQGGRPGAPVTLASYPGERARIVGRFWISKGADYVTVASLDLDGAPSLGTNDSVDPSPTVNANHATFVDDDVTNEHTAICFLLGNAWGEADGTVIQHNRIHDCGKLPAQNHDHGIYVELTNGTEIVDNLIYDNADRGVQLYPSAQNTHVAGNVIDGNGEGIIFSGDGGVSSNGNVVEDNIITNSNQRNNVESWYPSGTPAGHDNVVRNNCIGGGVRDDGDGGIAQAIGFTVEPDNVVGADPHFVDRAAKDFRLASDSPCAGIANGATGSSAQRVVVNPPTTPKPTDNSAAARPTRPAVTVVMRRLRHGHVRIKGRIRPRRNAHAAAAVERAVVQIRWHGGWFPVRSAKIVGKRFRLELRFPASMRRGVLKVRVVVPSVGRSRAMRLRFR